MIDRRTLLLGSAGLAALQALPVRSATGAVVEDHCDPVPVGTGVISGVNGFSDPTQICNAVNDQIEETYPESAQNGYNYRTRLFAHARVDVRRDPAGHIAKKMQNLWLLNDAKLTCNLLGFSVKGGSLLKLALVRDSNHFLDDVVRRWNIWLNHRDFTGQTLLDFTYSEMARSAGTPNENIMRRYAQLFERFGAKRAVQLGPTDRPPDPMSAELRPLLRIWDRACYFSEGLAAVKRGEFWGYVDAQGKVIVPPRYTGAFAFSQGRAAVHRNGKWGYINSTGNEVIPLTFADARVFAAGAAEVSVDRRTWRKIDLTGAPLAR